MKRVLILFSLFFLCTSAYADEKVKIAYMICVSKEDTYNRFYPLTKYIEEEIGKETEIVLFDAEDLPKMMNKVKPDFVHSNSLLYVIASKNFKSKLICTEDKGLGGVYTASVIFSRKGSKIKTLKDLKDKKMLFGPTFSPAGYLASYYTLMVKGVDPEEDLAFYSIPWGSYKHEKVLYGVYYQAFDIGSARYGDIEEMIELKIFDKSDFNIITKSEMIPYCTFYVADGVDAGLTDKVKKALLELGPDDIVEIGAERVLVTKTAKLRGYKEMKDSDYDLIRKMAEKIKYLPYVTE